jgi:hypothetical protein
MRGYKLTDLLVQVAVMNETEAPKNWKCKFCNYTNKIEGGLVGICLGCKMD